MSESGKVKFFNAAKGFGFITPDSGGGDVFVHISAVERSGYAQLEEGQAVQFETQPDPRGKGPKAVNIVVVGVEPSEDIKNARAAARPPRDFGDRPPRSDYGDRPPRRDFGDRPPRDFGDRPPRRDFGGGPPRGGGGGFGGGPPRGGGGGFGGGPPRGGGGGFGGGPRGGGFDAPPPPSDFGDDRPRRRGPGEPDRRKRDDDGDDWS